MKKLSFFLALMAGCMLPLTAVADNSSSSKSKSKRKKSSSKSSTTTVEEPQVDPGTVVGGKLSDEQLMLNNQAVAAVRNNEYKKAEQLYQALLQLGEFNYIWYQLGRTYARQDKCVEAYDAYSHVATAPILDPKDYDPETIKDATQKGITELDAQCSAKVSFTCNPQEMTLSIDGGVEFECSNKPVPLVPGRHSVYAKTGFGFNTVVVDAVADQITNSKVDVINFEEVAVNAGVTPEELARRSKMFKILGYTFIGAGVAIAAGGGTLWGVTFYGYQKDYEVGTKSSQGYEARKEELDKQMEKTDTYQYVGGSLIGVGSAMAITGIVLVVYDAVKIQPQLEEITRGRTFKVSPVVSPEFSGFALTGTF